MTNEPGAPGVRVCAMSGAFHERVHELFGEAIELDPQARAGFLRRSCGDDEALRSEVDAMLAAADSSDSYFSGLAERLGLAAILDQNFGLPEEDRIGAYRLIRLIGRGGMGAVYLAERADRQFEKRVALKVLPTGIGGAEAQRRFLAERQILAQLVHPGIARLLDGGITERGTPYFVMDYIDGVAVDAYCDEHRLDVDARLRLFCHVCDAVGYAHRNLVVHRDLKPANVLVEESGQVRLVDFGIAKVIDDEAAAANATRAGVRPMTPLYAAPEMLRREAITTATDVFGLGILLYELLTGRHPTGSRGELPEPELWQKICEAEPVALADAAGAARGQDEEVEAIARRRGTTPARLAQRLGGDLDTIVRKALKKDPGERYATVNALVEDVQRFLHDRPVQAQRDSFAYRAAKFVRRNRVAVGAAAAVLLAVLAGAAVSLWQARLALAEKERAAEVKDFITSIFRAADPFASQGRTLSAAELLQQARISIDRRFETRPALRVELLNVVGSSLMSLQDLDTAEAVLRDAEALAVSHLPAEHPEALRAQQHLVSVDRWRGDTQQMRERLEQILPALRAEPDRLATELVQALLNRTHADLDEGRFDAAEASADEAMRVAGERLDELDPLRIGAVTVRALAYLSNGKAELAMQTAELAQDMALRLHRDNAQHPLVIDIRALYARALGEAGRTDRAIEELEQAVVDAEAVFGPDSRQVAFYSQQLVDYYLRRGHIAEALASSRRALDILAPVVEPMSFTYGAGLHARGKCLLMARRGSEAARDLGGALEVATALLGTDHRITALTRARHALAQVYAGELADARAALGGADAGAARSSLQAFTLGTMARLGGRHAEALRLQQEALAGAAEAFAGSLGARQHVLTEIGLNHLALGEPQRAAAALEEALALYRQSEAVITPQRADALMGLGRARESLGRTDEALALLEAADAFWRGFDPANRWAGEAALWLGRAYAGAGRQGAAQAALGRARDVLGASRLATDAALLELAEAG